MEELIKYQSHLLGMAKHQINKETFPRFVILIGARGSGKKSVTHEICKMLNANEVICGNGINDIREIKNNVIRTKTVYVFLDADNMSIQANNSLLKFTEEPRKDVYIIMTVESLGNVAKTLQSRAVVYLMDAYKPNELGEYSEKYDSKRNCTKYLYESLCDTPGECDLLYKQNPQEFYDYVSKVVDNIATTSGSNVFKIADKIALKDSDDGYDLILFWKCFNKVIFDRRFHMSGIRITNEYLRYAKSKAINKQTLFDNWILDIREKWRKENEQE